MVRSWISRIRKESGCPKRGQSHRHARLNSVSLNVECLEDRLAPSGATVDPGVQGLNQIDHFVIVYQENWSFDSLFPFYPGANGIANAVNADGSLKVPQLDKSGNPISVLPAVLGPDGKPDPRFPTNMLPQPYDA